MYVHENVKHVLKGIIVLTGNFTTWKTERTEKNNTQINI